MKSGEPQGGFVAAGGVRLHFLDWGGRGEPLVLLPGLGHGAHVFRDLAPALGHRLRVLALSPRAHGESDAPEGGYTLASFAADLGAFLDAVGIQTAALAAHSFSGAVGVRFAAEHPGRVRRLVLIDALTDYASFGRVQAKNPVRPPPTPYPAGDEAEREWLRRYHYGMWSEGMEADFHARPPADELLRRRELLSHLVDEAARHPTPYARLQCPALALMAGESVETNWSWLDAGDEGRRALAADYLATVRQPWRRAEVERFRREARGGDVVTLPGHHFLFVSSRDAVAREMLAFLHPEHAPVHR